MVVLVCLAGATVIAALQVGQQRDDPLSESAEHGSWATLSASVAGFPRAVDSGFVAPDNGNTAPKDDVAVAGRRHGGAGHRGRAVLVDHRSR